MSRLSDVTVIDAKGRPIVPGLIGSHTHRILAGMPAQAERGRA